MSRLKRTKSLLFQMGGCLFAASVIVDYVLRRPLRLGDSLLVASLTLIASGWLVSLTEARARKSRITVFPDVVVPVAIVVVVVLMLILSVLDLGISTDVRSALKPILIAAELVAAGGVFTAVWQYERRGKPAGH